MEEYTLIIKFPNSEYFHPIYSGCNINVIEKYILYNEIIDNIEDDDIQLLIINSKNEIMDTIKLYNPTIIYRDLNPDDISNFTLQ